MKWVMEIAHVGWKRQKSDDSDDDGDDLPDVGIQAPNVTQKSQQPSV